MSFSRSSASALKQALKATAPKAGRQVAKRSYSLLARQAPQAMMATRLGVSGRGQRVDQSLVHNSSRRDDALLTHVQATRGVKTLDFAGTKEVVYERADWPLDKLQEWVPLRAFPASCSLRFTTPALTPLPL